MRYTAGRTDGRAVRMALQLARAAVTAQPAVAARDGGGLDASETSGDRIRIAHDGQPSGAIPQPDGRLISLYRRWGAGGVGLMITGIVMVHAEALNGPGGVVLDERAPLEPFTRWADAGKAGGAAMWMQISHPGRLVRAEMPGVTWGPSAAVELGKHSKRFSSPVAVTEEQIMATVERFVTAAALAEQAGFDGVEVHAAHGYLLSQFLSPLVNQRRDHRGGGLEPGRFRPGWTSRERRACRSRSEPRTSACSPQEISSRPDCADPRRRRRRRHGGDPARQARRGNGDRDRLK